MAEYELVAESVEPPAGTYWRVPVPGGEVVLGREAPCHLRVPADRGISSRHALLLWAGGRLRVRRRLDPPTTNPIVFREQIADDFSLAPGEEFRISKTRFRLERVVGAGDSERRDGPEPTLARSPDELGAVRFHDAADRVVEALAELPLLARCRGDAELGEKVLDLLLQGLPRADEAAVVQLLPGGDAERPRVAVRAGRRRDGGEVVPSQSLATDAVRQRQVVVRTRTDAGDLPGTFRDSSDWRLCAPLLDDASHGWGLYAAGRYGRSFPSEAHLARDGALKTDMRVAALIAHAFGRERRLRVLQQRTDVLSRFLSRPVRAAMDLKEDLDAVLRAGEHEVTVLFCDLRGSVGVAEAKKDDLLGLWADIGEALSIMTTAILGQDGVIGDFQGDAAMGFWGWPFTYPDQELRAVQAAWQIRERFAQLRPPAGGGERLRCGIGLAHGRAMAGKLGTPDQYKVSVYGPVVNLAARLETMTKQFGVEILVDSSIAAPLNDGRSHLYLCRPLAQVKPKGMDESVEVSELLGERLTEAHRDYDAARRAFLGCRWDDARHLLGHVDDGPSRFLMKYMDDYVKEHKAHPAGPSQWDGVIVMKDK